MNLQAYPFSSQRMPILADNGLVATSHPLAAQAGLTILQQGGNAVDAAIATATTLTVVEPTSNGIGGDAFALIWDGTKLHGLNASGSAPASLSASELRDQGYEKMPTEGWWPVTVPGAPAGWGDLHQRFGQLSLADLLSPAISYATEGYLVSPIVAQQWKQSEERFFSHKDDPALAHWASTFAPTDRAPMAGERWASPAHADTLMTLATQGVRDFYEGELAEKIVSFAQSTEGLLRAEDLETHQSQWVEPISIAYKGYEVWEIPPNGQGLAALIALSILSGTDFDAYAHSSVDSLHFQIEAMKLAFADAYHYLADPQKVDVPVEGLLDPVYITTRRSLISERASQPEFGEPPRGDTVYLCVVDRDGMMVSYIQSNFMGFGSGVVVPKTGIALHNRGVGFTLEPDHPNEAVGGKRPYHTIIPGFLSRNGQPIGPFGVMGGPMQPQGHVQVVSGMIDYGLNPQAVLDAPRWQVTGGLGVNLEFGTPEHILRGLAERGHEIQLLFDRTPFGRGQIIWHLEDGGYVAGSDMRSDGAAVGF